MISENGSVKIIANMDQFSKNYSIKLEITNLSERALINCSLSNVEFISCCNISASDNILINRLNPGETISKVVFLPQAKGLNNLVIDLNATFIDGDKQEKIEGNIYKYKNPNSIK